MARQFHRPARLDPEAAEQIEGSTDTAVASELADRGTRRDSALLAPADELTDAARRASAGLLD